MTATPQKIHAAAKAMGFHYHTALGLFSRTADGLDAATLYRATTEGEAVAFLQGVAVATGDGTLKRHGLTD